MLKMHETRKLQVQLRKMYIQGQLYWFPCVLFRKQFVSRCLHFMYEVNCILQRTFILCYEIVQVLSMQFSALHKRGYLYMYMLNIFKKYRPRCFDIEKNQMHRCNESQIAQQTIVFKKKIFLYRNENKFYSVDLLKVCRTISHVEKLKPIKSEISHHASNYLNHINHLMT